MRRMIVVPVRSELIVPVSGGSSELLFSAVQAAIDVDPDAETLQKTVTGDLSGQDPKGIFAIYGTGVAAGTEVADALMSVGFGDGTSQQCHYIYKHDTTNSAGGHRIASTFMGCNNSISGAGVVTRRKELAFNAWEANGITFDVYSEAAYTPDTLLTALLIGGGGITVEVGSSSISGTQNTTSDILPTNGLPLALIMFLDANNATYHNYTKRSLGFISKNGSAYDQCCYAANGNASGNWLESSVVYDNKALAWLRTTETGTVDQTWVATQITGDTGGVRLTAGTPSASHVSAGATVKWIALYGATLKAKAKAVALPTETGDWAVTGLGGIPKASILLGCMATTVNTVSTTTPDQGGESVHVFTSASAYGNAIRNQENMGANRSTATAKAFFMKQQDGTTIYSADLSSMDADGFTLNFATAAPPGSPTARQGICLMLG